MYDIGISNAIILSSHNGYMPYLGSIGINDSRFCYVGVKEIEREDCIKYINANKKILMPGLVNAHCHGDMTIMRGFGDDLTLLEQNQKYAKHNWFYKFMDDEDRYSSRQLTYCEALLSGTTFIMENMYWGLGTRSVDAIKEVGIRGALAEDIRKSFDQPDDFVSEEYIEDIIEEAKRQGIIFVLAGVSEEDFETSRLRKIEERRKKHNIMLTAHLTENPWRINLIEKKYDKTPIKYLYDNNLLNENIIGSHVVYESLEEIRYLKEKEVKVVNTPLCEMKIADGIAPIPEMIQEGVTVCLGTDGALWNNSNDIFREMKGMSLLHTINSGIRSLSKNDILDMATINGAKAFGIQKNYGTIEEGKKADFILVDTSVPHMCPLLLGENENITSHIIYNATGKDVTDVFVDGKHVVKDRRVQTINVQLLMKKVQIGSEKIIRKLSYTR